MVGQKAEQRRHEHRADIGSSHLDADDSLRLVAAKVRRRRMDDAGVDRRTAEADQNQAGQHDRVARREHHGHDAEQDQHLPHPDHTLVVHAHREEAVDGAPHRDADKEHRAEARRLFRRDALAEIQKAARPEATGLLNGTVAEEGDKDLPHTRYPEDLTQGERLALLCRTRLPLCLSFLPERQARE